MDYIIALDQGTTSSRAILVDGSGSIVGIAQKEFTQIFPKSGWVEHDPAEIWRTQEEVLQEVIREHKVEPASIKAIGITNQRETTVVWNRKTGKPIYNAIVWQDKRTASICERLKKAGHEAMVKQQTGLVLDSYFSGTKVHWILDKVPGARALAEAGDLAFGTIDSWLVWNLSGGKAHCTDYTNASRTLLFDIEQLQWSKDLLSMLDIPEAMLPEAKPSNSHFADYVLDGHQIPVRGILGDQQAALFGQGCFAAGEAKNTYGTGCFILMNTGPERQNSEHGLLSTIAWGLDDTVEYALEGSIFIAGAAVQWLRDGLRIIDDAKDSTYFALKARDKDNVYLVPAFAGLGTPYWDMYSRGAIFGLTRDTGKDEIIKATLESLAFQSMDVIKTMIDDSGLDLQALKVDGGAAANDVLMQFQADLLDVPVERPEVLESTAMGAAYLAGMGAGLWTKEDILARRAIEKTFSPDMDAALREKRCRYWKRAVERTMGWLDEDDE